MAFTDPKKLRLKKNKLGGYVSPIPGGYERSAKETFGAGTLPVIQVGGSYLYPRYEVDWSRALDAWKQAVAGW